MAEYSKIDPLQLAPVSGTDHAEMLLLIASYRGRIPFYLPKSASTGMFLCGPDRIKYQWKACVLDKQEEWEMAPAGVIIGVAPHYDVQFSTAFCKFKYQVLMNGIVDLLEEVFIQKYPYLHEETTEYIPDQELYGVSLSKWAQNKIEFIKIWLGK